MTMHMTRSRLIQVWLATVVVAIGVAMAFGASVSVGTGSLLLAGCLVPLGVILTVWPAVQPRTVAQVIHDAEERR